MNWKPKPQQQPAPQQDRTTSPLSYSGGGKVSVSVDSIVSSPKVQRQVESVQKIAEATKLK